MAESDRQQSTEALTRIEDCRVGMKVRHTSNLLLRRKSVGCGEGAIISITRDGVLVEYPHTGVRGLYDDGWFRYSGARLEAVRDR